MALRRWPVIAAAILAITLSGCSNKIGLFGEQIDPDKVDETKPANPFAANTVHLDIVQGDLSKVAPSQNVTFAGYWQQAANTPSDATLAREFMVSGMAVSDRQCLAWFEQLGQAQAKAGATADDLSGLGQLSATLMGLANASSGSIGGVSAGFLFGKQVISADTNAFIVTPDIGTVKAQIVQLRAQLAQRYKANALLPGFDYFQALQDLYDYDDQCSHLSVKKFVSDAVATAKNSQNPVASSPADADDALTMKAAGTTLGTLFANASGPLSSDVVVALYATVLAGAQVKDAGEANTFKTALQTAKLTDGAGAFQLKKGVTSDTLKQVLSVYNGQGALDRALAAKLAPPAPAPAKTGIAQAITAVTPLFKNPTPAPTQAQIVALFGLVLQPGLTAAQVANLRQAAGSTLVDGNGQPILNGTATMDQLKSALTAANADGSLATALKTALQ